MSEWAAIDDSFKPVVHFANRLVCRPGEVFGPRMISDYQLIFVIAGAGVIQIGNQSYRAVPGCLFFYGPGQPHRIEASTANPFVLFGVHFTPDGLLGPKPPEMHPPITQLSGFMAEEAGPEPEPEQEPGYPIPPYLQLGMWPHSLFETIVGEYRKKGYMAPFLLRGLMISFLARLCRWMEGQHTPCSPLEKHVIAVKEALEQKSGEPYDPDWLELVTPYSHDYMSRLYRDRFGLAPRAYHTGLRIETAKGLLEGTAWTVTEISERLQFPSVHYFCKWFKRLTGEQPTLYRKGKRLI